MFNRNEKLIPALMLAASGAALASGTGRWWAAPAAGGLALALLVPGLRIPDRPRLVVAALLALPFAAWYRSLGRAGFTGLSAIDLVLMLGFYSLALGLYALACARHGKDRDAAFASAIWALALAGCAPRNRAFLPALGVLAPLALLYLRQRLGLLRARLHPTSYLRHGLVLALLVALGGAIHLTLITQAPRLNRWFVRRVPQHGPDFSPQFHRLDSLAPNWDPQTLQQITLRCWGAQPPGHLRGAVSDYYAGRGWRTMACGRHVQPGNLTDHGRNVFPLGEGPAAEAPPAQFTLYPEPAYAETYFTPLGTQRLGSYDDTLCASDALTAMSPRRVSAGGYHVYETAGPLPPPTDADLQVPPELRAPLAALARQVLDPALPPRDQAARLAAWFARDFRYHIGIQIDPRRDPVLQFLQDIKAGHCEYFASAAVLLLRTRGIPARYVTGFVCLERGWGGGYYVARRRDAHAWVEYHVPNVGWLTFDPTPPDGQPQARPSPAAEGFGQWLAAWWARIWSVAHYGGVTGALAALWGVITVLLLSVPLWVWGLIIVVSLAWLWRRSLLRLFLRRGRRATPARIRLLQARLRQAERLAARHGLRRSPTTTVGSFLAQVRAADLPAAARQRVLALLTEYQDQRFRPPVT